MMQWRRVASLVVTSSHPSSSVRQPGTSTHVCRPDFIAYTHTGTCPDQSVLLCTTSHSPDSHSRLYPSGPVNTFGSPKPFSFIHFCSLSAFASTKSQSAVTCIPGTVQRRCTA